MARRKSQRRGTSSSVHWTKAHLLPIPDKVVSRYSLENHMALVGTAMHGGLKDSLIKLIRLTYLSFYLWEAGYGGDPEDFWQAERTLDSVVNEALESGTWQLDEGESSVIKRVVCAHDRQLRSASVRAYVEATTKLDVLLSQPRVRSPIGGCVIPVPQERINFNA